LIKWLGCCRLPGVLVTVQHAYHPDGPQPTERVNGYQARIQISQTPRTPLAAPRSDQLPYVKFVMDSVFSQFPGSSEAATLMSIVGSTYGNTNSNCPEQNPVHLPCLVCRANRFTALALEACLLYSGD
jgi:hypothetical protein